MTDGPMPALGLGTWRMGESAAARRAEVDVLRHALDAGIRLIDTAEMYGEGGAEEVVGEALAGRRDGVFLVSKVYPWNASRRGTVAACERSLKRMKVDAIDLYLLHWRGEHPLAETLAAFEALRAAGKIARWGVSNFDTRDMLDVRELAGLAPPAACAANQVYYNLATRWPEATLLPLLREAGVACMAYSPLDQGALARDRHVAAAAGELGITATQLALAWLMRQEGVVPIPKTSRRAGVDEIVAAADVTLPPGVIAALEAHFPPPKPGARMRTT